MTSASLFAALSRIEQQMSAVVPLPGTQSVASDLTRAHELLLKAGRHQMRTAQATEHIASGVTELISSVREELQQARSVVTNLSRRALADRMHLLNWADAQDDAMVLARQQGDPRLIRWFEKVDQKGIEALSALGVTEIAALGRQFDEEYHEALDLVTSTEQPASYVVSVVRRGFLFDGSLLRRSQVLVSKGAAT